MGFNIRHKLFNKNDKYYSIIPDNQFITKEMKKKYSKHKNKKGKKCETNFKYNSLTNKYFLSISEIKKLINKHLIFSKN